MMMFCTIRSSYCIEQLFQDYGNAHWSYSQSHVIIKSMASTVTLSYL